MTRLYEGSLDLPEMADVVVVTSASAPFVVLWASSAWLKLCGFSPSGLSILGRTLRHMQGPETNTKTVNRLMRAVHARQPLHGLKLINYSASGHPFSHTVSIEPVLSCEQGFSGRGRFFRARSQNVISLCDSSIHEGERQHLDDDFWGEELEDFMHAWSQADLVATAPHGQAQSMTQMNLSGAQIPWCSPSEAVQPPSAFACLLCLALAARDAIIWLFCPAQLVQRIPLVLFCLPMYRQQTSRSGMG